MPTIRFVGGPWHNRLEDVELAPRVELHGRWPPCKYYLVMHCTGLGTNYFQYVHSSLILGGRVHKSASREYFCSWLIDRKELESRLRGIMK